MNVFFDIIVAIKNVLSALVHEIIITKKVTAQFTFRVAPRPTGDSPVAACRAQQTMISIKLVSCLSSSAENGKNIYIHSSSKQINT